MCPHKIRRNFPIGAVIYLGSIALMLCSITYAQANWTHLSSANGDLPTPADSNGQPASLVLDVNKDGKDDFVIVGWRLAEDVVWYRRDADAGIDCQL